MTISYVGIESVDGWTVCELYVDFLRQHDTVLVWCGIHIFDLTFKEGTA